jgi:di/tricarboxylate transporter
MTHVPNSAEARRNFAEERSHKDAGIANEHARASAQAVILINGGAATAILAFLAKDKLDPAVLRLAPWCLTGYALGVIAGAFTLFFSTRFLEEYSLHWHLTAYPEQILKPQARKIIAFRYQRCMRGSFVLSVFAFFFSSCFIAYVLNNSIPPQQITVVTPPTLSASPPSQAPSSPP